MTPEEIDKILNNPDPNFIGEGVPPSIDLEAKPMPTFDLRQELMQRQAAQPPVAPNPVRQKLDPSYTVPAPSGVTSEINLPKMPKKEPITDPREKLKSNIMKKKIGISLARLVSGIGQDIAGAHGRDDAMFRDALKANEARLGIFDEANMPKGATGLSPEWFKRSSGLRKEYMNNKTTQRSAQISESMGRIYAVASKPSAAGDLALIFNFMKILDPGSVVRESEFRNAAEARAWLTKMEGSDRKIPAGVAQFIQKLDTGQSLLPHQRKDFVNQAIRMYGTQFDKQDRLAASFAPLAQKAELDVEDVVLPHTRREKYEEMEYDATDNLGVFESKIPRKEDGSFDYSKLSPKELKQYAKLRKLVK